MEVKRVSNLFTSLERQHGQMAFKTPEKIKKVRFRLVQFIRANQSYKRVVKSVIRGALSFYKRRCNSIKESPEKVTYRRNLVGVLVMAAHLCQEYNLCNSRELLQNIMSAILEVEDGFDRFFGFLDPLATINRIDLILFPRSKQETDLRNSDYHFKILEYFLREVGNIPMKMLYSKSVTRGNKSYALEYRRVSFVDAPLPTCYGCTPLTLSCHAINRRAIVTLLRYGADPEARGSIHMELGSDYPISVLLMQHHALNFWRDRIGNFDLENNNDQIRVTYEDYERQQLEVRRCLSFINRTVVDLANTAGRRTHLLLGMIPLLPTVHPGIPQTLQHLCRVKIRRALKSSGTLPVGIKQLPVHKILHKYLDLRLE